MIENRWEKTSLIEKTRKSIKNCGTRRLLQ